MSTDYDDEPADALADDIVHWRRRRRPPAATSLGSLATGSLLAGAALIGALAVGALAIGALAIGTLAIGRLAVGRVRLKTVEIDDLVVHNSSGPVRELASSGIARRPRRRRNLTRSA